MIMLYEFGELTSEISEFYENRIDKMSSAELKAWFWTVYVD